MRFLCVGVMCFCLALVGCSKGVTQEEEEMEKIVHVEGEERESIQ